VARPGDELGRSFQAIPGVMEVSQDGSRYVVRGERDLREDVARVAAGFGLLELNGRERLEDIYLALTLGSKGTETNA
jgi:hypothetical protein